MLKMKEKRLAKSLSQTELAERVGTTQKRISYWEAGRFTPKLAYAIKLARVLDCRVEDLQAPTNAD